MKDALIRDVQCALCIVHIVQLNITSSGNNRALLLPTSTGNAAELCGDVFCQE